MPLAKEPGGDGRMCSATAAEDGGFADLIELVAGDAEEAVERTVVERSAGPARAFAARLRETDLLVALEEDPEDGGHETLGVTVAALVLVDWLAGTGTWMSTVDSADSVLRAVAADLGGHCADRAAAAVRAIGVDGRCDGAIGGLRAELGDDFLPALIWLAAGAVRQFGADDIGWLLRSGQGDHEESAAR